MALSAGSISSIVTGSTNLVGSFLNFGASIYATNNSPDTIYNPTTIVRVADVTEEKGLSASTVLIYAGIILLVLIILFISLKIIS